MGICPFFFGANEIMLNKRADKLELLNLNNPIYEKTAAYGHFGRMPEDNGSFSWEKTDKTSVFTK